MIIPKPKELVIDNGIFNANGNVRIICDRSNSILASIARYLSDSLQRMTNIKAEIVNSIGLDSSSDKSEALIILELSKSAGISNSEGYSLDVNPKQIIITASAPAGLFYGSQTFIKLIKANIDKSCFQLPCLKIEDEPVFKWRGLLLDCSRHFLSKEYIKHCIDMLAQLKMNVLHWHLTDDHGWRIEIKKYPQLTKTGAYIEQGEACGGFYTQEDIKEIVEYAKDRYIEVMPEFDIPGHSFSVMKTLPWLCCTGNPERNKGHQKDLYCAGKKETLEFFKDILDEIIELFPSKYIHLGGDEAPKDKWIECDACQKVIKDNNLKDENELQGYLLNEVSDYLRTKDRTAICWDEAAECGVNKDTIIHWWRYNQQGERPLLDAVRNGHKILASPNGFTYLSFPVDPDEHFKPIRTFDLPRTYSAKYIPDSLTEEQKKLVIGAECCIWTEHLTENDIDVMLFPRILACAELMWSYPEDRDFDGFLDRARAEQERLMSEGVKFGPYFKSKGTEE